MNVSSLRRIQQLTMSATTSFVALTFIGCSNLGNTPMETRDTALTKGPVPDTNVKVHHAKPAQSGYSVFYNFSKTNLEGQSPVGSMALGSDGKLYGTTLEAYDTACPSCASGGAVFQANPTTGDVDTIFLMDYTDGAEASGISAGPSGGLYVSTYYGGFSVNCKVSSVGCGVLYKLTASGSNWAQAWIHNFPSTTNDGIVPSGAVLYIAGTLYGVTSAGGSNSCSCGTLYSVSAGGSGYSVLRSFNKNPASMPTGPLVEGSDGMLYGTTIEGGGGSEGCDSSNGCGVVYKIKKDGTDLTILHQFIGRLGSTNDGAAPASGVTIVDGDLYGTTLAGGNSGCGSVPPTGCGTIFKLAPTSSGYTETIIHKFDATSSGVAPDPSGLLLIGSTLYGTSSYGGGGCTPNSEFPNGCGRIFSSSLSGTVATVHAFEGPTTDGADPAFDAVPVESLRQKKAYHAVLSQSGGTSVGLAVDSSGDIWGDTLAGGSHGGSTGWGVIYSIGVGSAPTHRQQ
jgi:uncharacterized repeat protein (TIGR03803 family)